MFGALFDQNLIFALMGGLGLFLFGMKIVSEGLQKVTGDRIRKTLASLTNNRLVGTLVGLTVTAIIQSSSATTVMVVGFVNAGLLSLVQAISVVIGANIGTTLTAQIIAFKITHYALPVIGLGAALALFVRKQRLKNVGEILLGFGLLFYGLKIMKDAFEPLKDTPQLHDLFMTVGDNPLLGVLIGACLTMIVQSSSATIGITLAMASSGLLSFAGSFALILGENIGTTITANLAAIGTNLAARRTALAHLLFNALGVFYMLMLMPAFMDLVTWITPGDADFVIRSPEQAERLGGMIGDKPFIARHIANAHTLFNIVNTLIFLPLVGLLAKLASMIVRGREEEAEFRLRYLDVRVLNTPPIALGQARAEMRRMAEITLSMADDTLIFLEVGDVSHLTSLKKREEMVDFLQKEITNFLVALSQKSITRETSQEIALMMHMVNDIERIGDHCENLWQLGQRKVEKRISFSEIATQEIASISKITSDFLHLVVNAIRQGDRSILEQAQTLEDAVDSLEEALRNNHIRRLNTGECSVDSGLIFIDMIHNLEKIGDHSFKLAEAVAGTRS